jgi:uncharacterized protein YjbI with pentapeptide repeats
MISTITQNDLDLHAAWLRGDNTGVRLVSIAGIIKAECSLHGADLSGADLSGANLSGANLREANLIRADLSGANFSGADLIRADLREANLIMANFSKADLSEADLREANLIRANFSEANLIRADLSEANLRGANLIRADLSEADLREANLIRADLSGANLIRADLSGANFSGAKNLSDYILSVTSILPDGDLLVYKKASTRHGKVLLTLEIPRAAKRSNATGRKCRAEYAIMRAVEGIDWTYDGSIVTSQHDNKFIYPAIGETITPDSWDNDRWNECSYGVHFFLTRFEAIDY